MAIKKTWPALGVVAFLLLAVFVPSTGFARHGPGRHGSDSAPRYDTKSETTFSGTVVDLKTGDPSRLGRLMRVHTLGLGPKGVQEKQLLLKTGTDIVRIHLGPTAFLNDQKVKFGK
ncbi:MAG: hypothetical protein ABIS67_14450, partial [Candidatus Eisenbacteria bacterium]